MTEIKTCPLREMRQCMKECAWYVDTGVNEGCAIRLQALVLWWNREERE